MHRAERPWSTVLARPSGGAAPRRSLTGGQRDAGPEQIRTGVGGREAANPGRAGIAAASGD